MPLSPKDLRHLRAAEGYLELGMPLEANEELENIDADVRHVPEVLALRLEIYRVQQKWDFMQTVAKKLGEYDPENAQWPFSWAYAARRADSLDAARLILVIAGASIRKSDLSAQPRLLRVISVTWRRRDAGWVFRSSSIQICDSWL